MKIDQIWKELAKQQSKNDGLLLRRYSATVLPNIFVALSGEEQSRCVAATVNNSIRINLSSYSNFRDISLELLPSDSGSNKIILIKLLNPAHSDIFSVLSEDLIVSISHLTDEEQLIKVLLNRFEKWKSLFDQVSQPGLSSEQQQGLYGELFLLRKLLGFCSEKVLCIDSWVGCLGEIRDFQSGNRSIEVKTTQGNNHQRIQVSSERQLDTRNVEFLYVFHVSLDVRHNSGETLNQIVESLIVLLSENTIATNRFRSKLMESGYFDVQREFYAEVGYFIRQETFYLIEGRFPRIEENELRSGVGDVSYSIILSQCSDYIRSEEQVLETIAIL